MRWKTAAAAASHRSWNADKIPVSRSENVEANIWKITDILAHEKFEKGRTSIGHGMDMKLCYFMIDSNTFLFQVRKYVYHDADNLDTAFDAGGKVSIGLTATTIVSQWTWSATLLQSSTVASKVKITDTAKRHIYAKQGK